MNKLNYSSKFIVFGGLSLIALLTVSIYLIMYLSGAISTANQQLQGLKQTQNTSKLIHSLQQYRGLSSVVISGVDGSDEQQVLISNKVEEYFIKVDKTLSSKLKEITDWSSIIEQWNYLKSTSITLQTGDNFNLHSQLIRKLNSLQLKIADHFHLLLIDDLDSHYLVDSILVPLPITLELLGQARGVGAANLIDRKVKSLENIATLLSNASVPLGVFKNNIQMIKGGGDFK